jgi:hypothetical protein
MTRDELDPGLQKLLATLEEDSFLSTGNCVFDNLEDAETQEEFLTNAPWVLLGLCKEAADWAQKLLEYREGRPRDTWPDRAR